MNEPVGPRTVATIEMVRLARKLYGTDDVEIDEDAKVSDAMPEGLWIQAWVWLSAEEMEKGGIS